MIAPAASSQAKKASCEPLIWKLRLLKISSCSCMTKTNEVTLHAETCLYRVLDEAADALASRAGAQPDPVTWSEAVLLGGIQALCISADQEWCRQHGALSEHDKGWFAGQLHIFDMYTSVEKPAIAEARKYIGKLSAPAAEVAARPDLAKQYALFRVIECAEILNMRPRPMCRDCADEDGTCPNSGLECDMRKLFADARAVLPSHQAPTPTGESE